MIQAPSVNLAKTKTKTTMEVTPAESALMKTPRRQCAPFSRRCRATMPAPANVKPVNTPIA